MAKSTKKVAKGQKCSCNPGYMILGIILWTLGIFSLVSGFAAHFSGGLLGVALGWYFLGVILITLGKFSKWKSCAACYHCQ